MAGLFLASCATQHRGYDYKSHSKRNAKLAKRGYKPCNRQR